MDIVNSSDVSQLIFDPRSILVFIKKNLINSRLVIFISLLVFFYCFSFSNVYGSEYLDNQKLSKTLELCVNNHHVSDLCNLLTQDIFDYHNFDDDIYLDDFISAYDHINYAQTIGVVSTPIFLRYLPTLFKFAKNNMTVASIIFLITAAIAFKSYYGRFYDNLTLKIKDLSKTSPPNFKTLTELQISKRFQYYSQKGPEHEKGKLIPFLQDQKDQHQDQYFAMELLLTQEFHDFIKSSKKWYSGTTTIEDWNFNFLIDNELKDPRFIEVLDNLADLKDSPEFLDLKNHTKFQPNNLSKFDGFITQASDLALKFFHYYKLISLNSTYNHIIMRNKLYEFSTKKDLTSTKKIWNTLLLEHISHLELLEANKNPEFEEKIYLPFLEAKLNSLNIQRALIRKNIKPEHVSKKSDKKHLSLLPSQYLNYQDLDIIQLNSYLRIRELMLSFLLDTVENRISVWKRSGIYRFLPQKPASDQAFKDWSELFDLETRPLLYDFYNQENDLPTQ